MGKGENLGEFEQVVLLALLRLGGENYGMMVRRELEETAGRDVTIGAVYQTLERLERKRLVTSRRGDPDPVRGGKARRYFRVTAAGERALAESRDMMERMWKGIRLPGRA